MTPVTLISVDELEELFSQDLTCQYIMSPTENEMCGKPADWVWLFNVGCEHVMPQKYLCHPHHLVLDAAVEEVKRRNSERFVMLCIVCRNPSTLASQRRL